MYSHYPWGHAPEKTVVSVRGANLEEVPIYTGAIPFSHELNKLSIEDLFSKQLTPKSNIFVYPGRAGLYFDKGKVICGSGSNVRNLANKFGGVPTFIREDHLVVDQPGVIRDYRYLATPDTENSYSIHSSEYGGILPLRKKEGKFPLPSLQDVNQAKNILATA